MYEIQWSFSISKWVEQDKLIVERVRDGVFNIIAGRQLDRIEQVNAINNWYKKLEEKEIMHQTLEE
jgi:predicted transcriptional regulator